MECLVSKSRSIRVNGGPPAQHTWSSILLHSTLWALSEMDIILVFETSDAGSIPAGPTKLFLKVVDSN